MILRQLGLTGVGIAFVCGVPALAQSLVVTNEQVPFDNLRDRHLNFDSTPIQPLCLSQDETKLFAVNQPGSRLSSLDPYTLLRDFEVRIGLGAVSVVRRPGANELWVVDSLASCINVVDPAANAVVRTIAVGAEPHGLVFTPSGDRAYVSCSGVDRVDVIRTSTYRVVKSIAIPARCPRGMAYLNGRAWVVSFLSGNNTAPEGTPGDPNGVVTVQHVAGGATPLPDRDLFAIPTQAQPEQDDLDPSATVTGLGTTLFNLHARPGTNELWIPNTEALNALHTGEVNFPAGQVVRNRITIVDATGSVPPRFVDLDALAPSDRRCGQPAFVAFDPLAPRAFVCGYGNDLVAVLGLRPGAPVSWVGGIELPPKQPYPRGTGPRACVVDAFGRALYVFNKVDNSITKVVLNTLPNAPGWLVTAPIAKTLGHDPTSDEERLGRHLFSNARFSASQTSSCASCHVDGHTDGLAWDLSSYLDPEGTPSNQLQYGVDMKGPLVTQSVRRMADSGPFHWRGEKGHIDDFQGAFPGLLENMVNGVVDEIGPDFQYLRHYVDRLAYPPNPRQSRDRRYTLAELRGATLFTSRPVHGALTCAACHQLPTGTSGEIVAVSPGGILHSADVPQLRGVADKLSPPFLVGALFGTRSELGAGLTHGGAVATIQDSIRGVSPAPGRHRFDLTAAEADSIAGFLSALDTGVAPAAATLVTANASNWTLVASKDLTFLRQQAELGHCDLVYMRAPRDFMGQLTHFAGVYDTATGKYRVAAAATAPLDESVLLQEAANGMPVSFLGVPVGMGMPTGLDRDLDGLLDLDEIAQQTDLEGWDTDHDNLPDGYEVAWGLDPLQVTFGSGDTQPPALVGPARLVFATTNTIKLEFTCSEPARVILSYNGGYPVQRSPLFPQGDTEHWVVLNDLQPDTAYQIALQMKDASGNVATDTSTVFRTRARATPEPARVTGIGLSVNFGPGGGIDLRSDVALKTGALPVVAGYQVEAAAYHVRSDGTIGMVASHVLASTQASGVATFQLPLPLSGGTSLGAIVFVVLNVGSPGGAAPYVSGMNVSSSASIPY